MKKVEIIAEVAQAHEGSLGILHSYIDAIAKTGADTVKFQMHIAEAESSIYEPFRVKFSYVDKTRFDYWKRMSFSTEEWIEIKKHCEDKGLKFLCSPFSVEAVATLEKIGAERYKIASGEVTNNLLLEIISRTRKPVMISSGMSSFSEIDRAVEFFRKKGNPLSLFQCTTSYPTPAENVGLNIIPEMISRYNLPVGLSDHSGEIYPSLGAVALGATKIEVHVVFDKCMFGPDSGSSLTIKQLSQLVEGIRFLTRALENPVNKDDNEKYEKLKNIFGKSLAVRYPLSEGHILRAEDLESKKPAGYGIAPSEYKNVIGKRLNRKLEEFSFLNYKDFE